MHMITMIKFIMFTKISKMLYLIVLMDLMWIGCISALNEPGWIINGDLHYFYSDTGGSEKMTQDKARSRCFSFGADLLSITNHIESDFVTKDISMGYWSGLYTKDPCDDCATPSSSQDCAECRIGWEWLDGTPYEYLNWHNDRPSVKKNCSRLFDTGDWTDQDCNDGYHFICKRKSCCSPSPCQHGECKVVYTEDKYNCTCHEGYTGRNCTEEINECASDPCVNNATCINGIGYFNCVCAEGWNGTTCQLDIDECHESHVDEYCEHGICTNFDGGYYCNCFEGYHGDKCKQLIDDEKALIGSFAVCLVFLVLTIAALVALTCKQSRRIKFLERQQEQRSSDNDAMVYYNVTANHAKKMGGSAYVCESGSVATGCDRENTENQDMYQQISDYEKLQKDANARNNNVPNMYDTIAKS